MSLIPDKTLEDLEFGEILKHVSKYALNDLGKNYCLKLKPLFNPKKVKFNLDMVSEFNSSFQNKNTIPNHDFFDCNSYFKILEIENSVLEINAYNKISSNINKTNQLIRFFFKFKNYYPNLFDLTKNTEENKDIIKKISSIIDSFDEIKDKASKELFTIRNNIKNLKKIITINFNKSLSNYNNLGYLDDIKESIYDNIRVLAVKAMHRRKIKGHIVGASKTGSIIFIEPQNIVAHSLELKNLFFDEKEEVRNILSDLTDFLRPYLYFLETHQKFLIHIDSIYARAKYAEEINGIKPEFNSKNNLELKKAYHPLLFVNNKKEKKETLPQDVNINKENRIIIISGPNAGGKSITLKTIGLLQLMFQSGILIPVDRRSSLFCYDQILTDIGDNQSIENHLSTYSYRLNKMKFFLKQCNDKTLFLIDEFGTGSDPELGGALAESLLESFYEKKSHGVITTHYSNLKALANELSEMSNANMEFNIKTLNPTFKLIMGEAGGSFTFEVAKKNGIPDTLIKNAKKKIEKGKLRFDEIISKLQKQRIKMSKTETILKEKEIIARNENEKSESLNLKLKKKLVNYQELYDHNQKMILLGSKINDIAEKYFINNKKRILVSELIKVIKDENSKRKKKKTTNLKSKNKAIQKEIDPELIKIRKEKKTNKKNSLISKKENSAKLKIGDHVRLYDGKSIGTIDSIDKGKAVVNYGSFITHVDVNSLELVSEK
tara:strand:- start:2367 stop:4523 length:2157 start_codon:yes stop_codon:yes gene_type:complete